MSKRKKKTESFIPRLPDSMRDAINRSGTVLSKKRYNRHGRHMNPKNYGADIQDQLRNSKAELFYEECMEYLEYFEDDLWDLLGEHHLHEEWDMLALERDEFSCFDDEDDFQFLYGRF